ncbi:uncharacterized protein [Leptinotarsa decemlineata]|uniref:uncharacterized protein n=1 Tax=Leptinotarsa decemlineata TaxID=7539 RepID=UPI003D30A420
MDTDELQPLSTKSFYGRKNYKHLDMALDDLEISETQNSVDILVFPPNVDSQTDEEDDDDDYIQERENTLPRDVAEEVELHFHDNDSGSNYSDGSDLEYDSRRQCSFGSFDEAL